MEERPILFSAPMVRAIIEGSKTQTRRIVKPQPTKDYVTLMPLSGELVGVTKHGGPIDNRGWLHCPYGKPGDRLWVRETHAWYDPSQTVYYKASETDHSHLKWRPSIHMPRWASRITLEVESVGVERLQEISEADAIAEGIIMHEATLEDNAEFSYAQDGFVYESAKEAYKYLWESINGPGSWDANPWVWVVTFKRIKP